MSIKSKEDLLNKQAEVNEQIKSYTCRVLVCSGTGCVATGSQKIYEKFMEIAKDAPGVTIEFGPHDKDAHAYRLNAAGRKMQRRLLRGG